ncbi:helix-turn-helix domain-containing protein [Labrys neptuniae]
MISGSNVRRLRMEKGWSQSDLAKAVGISQTAIQKIEDGRTEQSKFIFNIARALGVPLEELEHPGPIVPKLEAAYERVQAQARVASGARRGNASSPRYQRFPKGKIPILGRAAAGANGRFIMNGEQVGTTFCPSILEGVDGAYATYVFGTSMVKRYYPGETVWVNPYLPVAQDNFVVAQIRGENDDDPLDAYVKQFVSRNSKELVLRQFNPPEGEDEFMRFPESKVFSVHKIVFSGES